MIDEKTMTVLRAQVAAQPWPLLFATVSGAHLYGFASPDSDFDLRGAHVLPLPEVLRLETPSETVDSSDVVDGLEIDVVSHDVRKFFTLMLRRNGYVLEQALSPLVVATSPWHEELRTLAKGCVTRHHVHHYRGFAKNEWGMLEKQPEPRVKTLLYVYRVLLTGIHLMKTGEVEASLGVLAPEYGRPELLHLIAQKVSGTEKGGLGGGLEEHRRRVETLFAELDEAAERSNLPEEASSKPGLDDLLVRVRMARGV